MGRLFVNTEVEINAPPSKVREILLDFKTYNDWNTLIRDPKIEKSSSNSQDPFKLIKGDVLKFFFIPLNGTGYPVVETNTEQEFSWLGVGGHRLIFSGLHFFKFKSIDDGKKTILVHGEDFTGLLVGPFKWFKGGEKEVEKGYTQLSNVIKQRAETSNL
ncbi:hypothetical protein WICMUC_005721 [Wickerhamomyces mucosus]|uniref:Polyketide cyclase/dehydrase n=1 Tax=Wickerhamomyces mucosus TaxID=1378264 RepID=A0A9P8T349_9ASCO|nr:hypothetical protein WICMUC_005721 [Wickerhamomyces mucosus]